MPGEGWNAPDLHHIDDTNVKTSFQDLRDYLGPYSMHIWRNGNTADMGIGAEFKIQFNTILYNKGDKFKLSTDGFGIIIPWKGLYNVQLSHTLQVTAGGVTGVMTYCFPALYQYDEVTRRRAYGHTRVIHNPLTADAFPGLHSSNTFEAVAGDRVYGYAFWNSFGAGAPTAQTYGGNSYTSLVVTYVGKTG